MYLIISWFYSLGKISGIVPEPKLKNWKTEFSREIQEEILHMDSIFQFLSFAYGTIPEYFRIHFGIFAEKLKNWKIEFSREIQEEILHMNSILQFFNFACGTIPEYFRRYFGIFAEKLKNWKIEKTEKLNFPERSRKRFSIWIQFFCFSVFLFFSFFVFQFCGRIGQKELDNYILRNSFLHVMYILHRIKIYIPPPQKNFQNLQAKMRVKHYKYHYFCWTHTEKLKNCFCPERSRERFSIKNSFSIFQFCLRKYSGTFPETKLKNWKIVFFQRDPGRDFQKKYLFFFFFNFSILLTELFRNISGDKTEKLKNCFFMENLSLDLSGKKQFCNFAYGTLPEHFRKQN